VFKFNHKQCFKISEQTVTYAIFGGSMNARIVIYLVLLYSETLQLYHCWDESVKVFKVLDF